jgi:hypothetical protein
MNNATCLMVALLVFCTGAKEGKGMDEVIE